MSVDPEEWKNAAQMLAAQNARLCDIAIAADKLAEFMQRYVDDNGWRNTEYARWERDCIRKALDEYKIVRNGS